MFRVKKSPTVADWLFLTFAGSDQVYCKSQQASQSVVALGLGPAQGPLCGELRQKHGMALAQLAARL